jgi:hypothetical protein
MSTDGAIIFTYSLHGLAGFALNLVALAIIGIGLLCLLIMLVRHCSESNSDAVYVRREAEREMVIEREQDRVVEDSTVVAAVGINERR